MLWITILKLFIGLLLSPKNMQKKIDKIKKNERNEKECWEPLFKKCILQIFSGLIPRSLSRKKGRFSRLTRKVVMVRIASKWKRRITCKLMYHCMREFWEQKNRFRINIKEYSFILYEISL